MTDATEQNTLPESDGAQAPTATPERVDESGRSEQSGRGKQDPGPGEQFAVRAAKRERLRAEGWEPYPVRLPITTTIAAVRERYGHLQAGQETDDVVGVAGRVVFLRNTGKLCFVTLADGAGTTLQAMLSAKALPGAGHTSLAAFKSDVDLGDHVWVEGRVISSKRGELSVMAKRWRMASKALRPLPVLHKELSEESRVRRRYVDLIAREDARAMVRNRAAITHAIRDTLYRQGYMEVETPQLQLVHGGAAARPFTTHLNAFDIDMSLRIALELHLKRTMVGGADRVYEMGRVFRNEGIDSSHSAEFTMLEAYQSWGDQRTIAQLIQDIIVAAADAKSELEDFYTRLSTLNPDIIGGSLPAADFYVADPR